jgi:hypothetical protein
MAETQTENGTLVRHPSGLSIQALPGITLAEAARHRRRRRLTEAAAPPSSEIEAIVAATAVQGIRAADAFELAGGMIAGRRRREVTLTKPIEVEVSLGDGEAAMMLIESEGVFAWQIPEVEDRRRRLRPGVARFSVPLPNAEPRNIRRRRGWLRDRLIGAVVEPIRIVILKFVAAKAVDLVTKKIEENVEGGLVPIDGDDPASWRVGEVRLQEPLPTTRPPRVLLMVHGTFSSTMGSFGALGRLPWGREFLDRARKHYDFVLGFDHKTLSEDPEANARALLAALRQLDLPSPPVIDAVAYSRGGLVLRVFAEKLLPASDWRARVERVAFVGCTHGGTALADPENWHSLLDLYTNVAVAGTRVLEAVGGGLPATILGETVKTLAGLARAIVVRAVEEENVPGLAAMRPGSALTKDLLARPAPRESRYFAVTADFEPDPSAASPGMSTRLVELLADGVIDRLMGKAANDLVVDTESMTRLGDNHLEERLEFGTTGAVYHTVYFPQVDVVKALGRWLGIVDAPKIEPVILEADAALDTAIERLGSIPLDSVFVVEGIERGNRAFYPRRLIDLVLAKKLKENHASTPLRQALDLRKAATAERFESDVRPGPDRPVIRIGKFGQVVLRNDGVVEANAPPLSGDAFRYYIEKRIAPVAARVASQFEKKPRRSRGASPLVDEHTRAPTRGVRAKEPMSSPKLEANRRSAKKSSEPRTVSCHVHAEMPEQPPIEQEVVLVVTVARHQLDALEGATSQQRQADFRIDQKITIQVRPRVNCDINGDDRIALDVPAESKPIECSFRIEGKSPGPAELWVDALQEGHVILRLVLQPAFVQTQSTLRADAVGTSAEPEGALVQLSIYEDDHERPRLLFVLHSDDLDLNASEYSNRLRDETKLAYVNSIYRRLETYIGETKHDYDQFIEYVRDVGSLLYEELVPQAIRDKLWQVRHRIGCIRVISQEPAIPWEIAHFKQPGEPLQRGGGDFFADYGLVRWLDNVNLPPARLRYAPSACHYLVPEYERAIEPLPGAKQEKLLILKLFPTAHAVEPSTNRVRDLLSDGGFDLLHVAGHGQADSDSIWEAALILQSPKPGSQTSSEKIEMSMVSQRANLRDRQPIVFLNACQLGQQGRTLSGTGGLAAAFIRSGAGLVVSTLWSIADEEALTFAKAFYTNLIDGHSLVQATKAARQAAARLNEPTWLAYTVFGHPYARLVQRPTDGP